MLITNIIILIVYPSIAGSFTYDNNDCCKERFGTLYWI